MCGDFRGAPSKMVEVADVDDPPLLGTEQQLSRSLAIRCPACLRG